MCCFGLYINLNGCSETKNALFMERDVVPWTYFWHRIPRYRSYREGVGAEVDVLAVFIKLLANETTSLSLVHRQQVPLSMICMLRAPLCFYVGVIWL